VLSFECYLVIIAYRSTRAAAIDMTDPLDAMKARWSHIQGSLFAIAHVPFLAVA
jgi:hypothetical protein